MVLRVFAKNLLRGNGRKNIFPFSLSFFIIHYSFYFLNTAMGFPIWNLNRFNANSVGIKWEIIYFFFLPLYRGALVSCRKSSNKFSTMLDLASASIISLSLMSHCLCTQMRVMVECLAIFSSSYVFLDFEGTFSRDLMVAL